MSAWRVYLQCRRNLPAKYTIHVVKSFFFADYFGMDAPEVDVAHDGFAGIVARNLLRGLRGK